MVNHVEILTRMIDRAVDIVIYIALFRTIRRVAVEKITKTCLLNRLHK